MTTIICTECGTGLKRWQAVERATIVGSPDFWCRDCAVTSSAVVTPLMFTPVAAESVMA